jgi:hypothetical protein
LNRTRKLFALCATALVVPALIAGCGGDDGGDEDPAELLRTALTTDTEYESGVLNIGLDGSISGTTSGSIQADVTGPFQSGGEGAPPELDLDANATISAEGIPELPAGSFSFDFEGGFALADDSLFVTYQDTTYEASQRLYSEISPLLESASSASETTQADPESADEFVNSLSNLSNEGTEDVNGEEMTRVSGDLDFANLVEQSGQAIPPEVASVFENLSLSIDFLIAGDDTVRGADVSFALDELPAEAAASGVEGVDFTFSFSISDAGGEQTIEAPTDTQPLDELLRQFNTSEAEIAQALSGALVPGLGGSGLGQAGEIPGLGTPGGSASDPQVQECIAEAKNPDEIVACLDQ